MSKKFNELYSKHTLNLKIVNKPELITCKICGKQIKSIAAFTTHLLRSNGHHLDIDEYVYQYFTNLRPGFKYEKCGFCSRDALPKLVIDFIGETFYHEYDEDGYFCNTDECKNQIALNFFGKPYAECIRQYEHIGAKTKYLALLHKKSEEYVKLEMKRDKNFVYSPVQTTSLKGYIFRYGKKEGTRLYKERCQKISRSLHIEWFIEKYGIDEGTRRYEERIKKRWQSAANITHSKNQYVIFDALNDRYNNVWQDERYIEGLGCVDMVDKSKGIVVEYFGDYWHCNPMSYSPDFFQKSLQMYAKQKWEKDRIRLQKILNASYINLIIVIWEKTFTETLGKEKTLKKLFNIVDNIDKKKKKEIVWI